VQKPNLPMKNPLDEVFAPNGWQMPDDKKARIFIVDFEATGYREASKMAPITELNYCKDFN
jgi:hypothetical protein